MKPTRPKHAWAIVTKHGNMVMVSFAKKDCTEQLVPEQGEKVQKVLIVPCE